MANSCHLSDASLKVLQKMDECALHALFFVLNPDICGFVELPPSIDEAKIRLSGISKRLLLKVETVLRQCILHDIAWFLVKCFNASLSSHFLVTKSLQTPPGLVHGTELQGEPSLFCQRLHAGCWTGYHEASESACSGQLKGAEAATSINFWKPETAVHQIALYHRLNNNTTSAGRQRHTEKINFKTFWALSQPFLHRRGKSGYLISSLLQEAARLLKRKEDNRAGILKIKSSSVKIGGSDICADGKDLCHKNQGCCLASTAVSESKIGFGATALTSEHPKQVTLVAAFKDSKLPQEESRPVRPLKTIGGDQSGLSGSKQYVRICHTTSAFKSPVQNQHRVAARFLSGASERKATRRANIVQELMAKEEAEFAECTFHPQLSGSSRYNAKKSIRARGYATVTSSNASLPESESYPTSDTNAEMVSKKVQGTVGI